MNARIPQLYDTDWLFAHRDVPYEQLAGELNCHPATVSKAYRCMGIYHLRRWSPLERAIIEELYPHWYGHLIARALGRTLTSFWAAVSRRWDLDPGRKRDKYPPEMFWPFWRAYVLEHLEGWLSEGFRDIIERFILRPREVESTSCRRCPSQRRCRETVGLLCADLPLGEVLLFNPEFLGEIEDEAIEPVP